MQSISLADELTLEPAPAGASADEVVCPGVPGPPQREPRRGGAAGLPREHRLGRAAAAAEHRQADPRRRRAGGRLGRRRRRAAPGRARLGARRRGAAARAGRASSAPTSPRRSRPGAGWPRAPASACSELPDPSRLARRCSCCRARPSSRPRRSTREADRLGLARERAELERAPRALRGALEPARRCRPRASCSTTTCSAAAISLCPEIAAALEQARAGGRGARARERLGADGRGAVLAREPADGTPPSRRPRGAGRCSAAQRLATVAVAAPRRALRGRSEAAGSRAGSSVRAIAVRHNREPEKRMSRTAINDLVAVCRGRRSGWRSTPA